MTDELTDDQQRLLEQLPTDGTTIGNKALRERLDWDEDRYWRERNRSSTQAWSKRVRARGAQ